MGTKVILHRTELYALVWAEPLSTLAKRYGLSTYALRQICIRLAVPLPRGEHWKKLRAGRTIEPPRLPTKAHGDQSVELMVSTAPTTPSVVIRPGTPEDPLVTAARRHLSLRAKENLYDGLARTQEGYLNIDVSPGQIDRACQLFNELLQALRAKGYSVQVEGNSTSVKAGGEPLAIRLREKTTRKTIRPTGWAYDRSEMVPNGNLGLQATARHYAREWVIRDRPLPEEAADLVSKLERVSADDAAYQADLEIRWAERDKKVKAEQAIRDHRAAELTGFKNLLQAASRWRQSQWIREYLAAMEKQNPPLDVNASTAQSPDFKPGQPITADPAAWLAWARAKADWYDPLTETADEWLSNINRDTLA
jgi:hypothetical protein